MIANLNLIFVHILLCDCNFKTKCLYKKDHMPEKKL